MELINKLQTGVKKGSQSFAEFSFRFISGFFVGLTMTIAGQTLFQYGNFLFWFVIISCIAVFLKLSNGWAFSKVFIFDLVFILICLVLRMYIMIAPGA